MTVTFNNDAETTNGTAGTSVVVNRPTGTNVGDLLLAFISATNLATFTPPAGWNPIGSQDASTSMRAAAYWRPATVSDPASWTWTLGSSQRNIGYIVALPGANLNDPILDFVATPDTTAGTSWSPTPPPEITTGAAGVGFAAAVRTASGAATTWTTSATERADLSTNAGAGTDIAAAATTTSYTGTPDSVYVPSFTSSQSCTAGVVWAITVRPAFIGYDGGMIQPIVEAAFGADPASDPDTWVWTDITAAVTGRPAIAETGRDDRGGIDEELASTRISFRLKDSDGRYMPDNPNGLHYPNIIEDVPVRLRVPFGYVTPTTVATAFVDRWSPSWDESGTLAFVDVTASGRLQRARTSGTPVHSALHRKLLGATDGFTPHAYYPCEDGSGATRVASAFPGHQPLQVSGPVSFGSASDLAGSDPLPSIAENGVIGGALGPGHSPTGLWAVSVAIKLPETPVSPEARLLSVRCSGTAMDWGLYIVAGSPDTLTIRASTWGASLLDQSLSIVEADHYGKWRLYTILVKQDGADVDWEAWSHGSDDGIGNSGTLAGRTIGAARTVRVVAFAPLDGMAAGHIVLHNDPAFTSFDLGFIAFAALDGNTGDLPYLRFQRLCQEEGIPYDSDWDIGRTSIGMGPQKSGSLGDLLQEAADAELGLMHDAKPNGDVVFATRWARYNQSVALTLDGNLGQIPASLRPTADGQSKITDSTVTRDGGSSARYAAADARGSRPDTKTLSLETDQHLLEIAGWRVGLGNQTPLRYTQVPLNLRASPELAEAWMNCTIGSRVKAINLPATHGPTEADGILVGFRQEVAADWWMVYMNLAPARPYDTPELESGTDTAWRLDTGGSELASSATSSTTSLSVAVTGEALWSTTDEPWDIDVNGERMTVTAVTGAISPQTFTVVRGVAGGATAKAHASGVAVTLWRPRGLAL